MSVSLIARTVRGLEFVAADEIGATLPARDVQLEPRQVRFSLETAGPALADLRTVDDVFVVVGGCQDYGHKKEALPLIARAARRLDWSAALDALAAQRSLPRSGGKFDVVVSLLGRRNYSRFDVEDAVGEVLSGRFNARYVSRRDPSGPAGSVDVTVRVFVTQQGIRFALRFAATPLHRRAYKQDTTKGTLHPPVAAAMARLLTPRSGDLMLDPFCGDGTIPIEFAMTCTDALITASDLDPTRVRNTRVNAERAGTSLRVEVADAGRLSLDAGSVDILATNPPWSVSVTAGGSLRRTVNGFWDRVTGSLSNRSRIAAIMDSELDAQRVLTSQNYAIAFAQRLRLAGRLVDLVVAAPPGRPEWRLADGLLDQREAAKRVGLLTETGFQNPTGVAGRG